MRLSQGITILRIKAMTFLNYKYLLILPLVIFSLAVAAPHAQATAFQDPGTSSGSSGGGGDLVPVDEEVEGGTISVGSTAQVAVLFRNESGLPIETGAIQLYPSSTVSASVSLNQCTQEPIPAGATCAIALSVKGLQPGSWRVEMIMRHSGRARLTRATLSGDADVGDDTADRFVSDIEAIPSELDFGDLDSSQPVVRGVVLRNTTSTSIDIDSIYIEASERSGYSLKTDCSTLGAGEACIVVVTWSPVLEGQASGVLLIEHNGPSKIASINLSGLFEPETSETAETFPRAVPGKGLLVASQDEIDFGSGIATTSAITVSLVNVGDSVLTISDINQASTDNGLNISQRGCTPGTILEPVEACPLTISWSPVREGPILDDIQIVHDGARGVLVLPVRGSSTGIISQDTKAVRLGSTATSASLARGDSQRGQDYIIREDGASPASVLDGFIVTSHAPTRAIISGPGGSRIGFDGEDVVVGGFLWNVNIRSSGVEFRSGDEKVLLLFDRSLSSVNRVTSQSSSSNSGGGGGLASP